MTCFINEEKKRTRNKHLHVATPRENSSDFFFPRFFFPRPTKKRSSILLKQVIYVFLGVKHIHVREKKEKRKKKKFVKSFGEKKKFFWEIFFSRFQNSKRKILIQFFRSSLARAVSISLPLETFLIFFWYFEAGKQ